MIALISDVHGNYEALKSVLADIDKKNIETIICLGDIVGYYSQVNECCDELRRRNVQCLMGNHDWYLASGTLCERSRSVNDCLAYQKLIITKDNLEWVRSFKTMISSHGLCMVHGGWNNPIDEYIEPSKEYFDKIDGLYFCSGHTHIQRVADYGDKLYCNPGAVGQPRDGDNRAAYAIFDNGEFTLCRVAYDYKRVGELMEEAGFEKYYYGCLYDASLHLHS